jgi:hypothetical protein
MSQLHDPQLDRWLDRLQSSAALQPHDDPSQYYLAEHTRTLALPPFELLVRYDALIADGDRAEIIDWKTYARPKHPQTLAKSWQTRLYRYVLAATSDYPPDRIAMVYWFAEPAKSATNSTNPQGKTASDRVTFPYDIDQFKRDHHAIAHLLDRLATLLAAAGTPQPFPTRLDLGQPCDPQDCACVQLQLLRTTELSTERSIGRDTESEAAIRVGDISEIEELAP